MRFCDLFISYKIELKSIKSTIPFTKLPLYRKVFIIILLVGATFSGILCLIKQTWASYIPITLSLLSLIVFFIIDSRKRNLELMLKEHYIPYSKMRMNMTIDVLKKFDINIENLDSLDMLIDEAKYAQIQCDYLSPLKKPLKTLGAIIIPIIVFVTEKIGDAATQEEMIFMAVQAIVLILLIFSLIFSRFYLLLHFLCLFLRTKRIHIVKKTGKCILKFHCNISVRRQCRHNDRT